MSIADIGLQALRGPSEAVPLDTRRPSLQHSVQDAAHPQDIESLPCLGK